MPKYTVSNIISNSLRINELYILKRCVVCTGGLEVSFSIHCSYFVASLYTSAYFID